MLVLKFRSKGAKALILSSLVLLVHKAVDILLEATGGIIELGYKDEAFAINRCSKELLRIVRSLNGRK